MYTSPNNPGAEAAATKVQDGLPQLQLTTLAPLPVRGVLSKNDAGVEPTVFLLYLNNQTYLGDSGDRFADELRAARTANFPILMLHENDEDCGGCEVRRAFLIFEPN